MLASEPLKREESGHNQTSARPLQDYRQTTARPLPDWCQTLFLHGELRTYTVWFFFFFLMLKNIKFIKKFRAGLVSEKQTILSRTRCI